MRKPFLYLDTIISIHAPGKGSDGVGSDGSMPQEKFQSTLPVKGATKISAKSMMSTQISIHALGKGSDAPLFYLLSQS